MVRYFFDIKRLMILVLLLCTSSVGYAHAPHDHIDDIAISPVSMASAEKAVFILSRNLLRRSLDGGKSWRNLQKGLSSTARLLRVSAASDESGVFVLVSSANGEIFYSHDGGETFSASEKPENLGNIASLEIDAKNRLAVVLLKSGNLLLSANAGETFKHLSLKQQKFRAMQLHDDGEMTLIGFNGHLTEYNLKSKKETAPLGNKKFCPAVDRFSPVLLSLSPNSSFFALYCGQGNIVLFDRRRLELTEASPPADDLVDVQFIDDSTLGLVSDTQGFFRSKNPVNLSFLKRLFTWQSKTIQPLDSTREKDGLTYTKQAKLYHQAEFSKLVVDYRSGRPIDLYLIGFDGLFKSHWGSTKWDPIGIESDSTITGATPLSNYCDTGSFLVSTYLAGAFLCSTQELRCEKLLTPPNDHSFLRVFPAVALGDAPFNMAFGGWNSLYVRTRTDSKFTPISTKGRGRIPKGKRTQIYDRPFFLDFGSSTEFLYFDSNGLISKFDFESMKHKAVSVFPGPIFQVATNVDNDQYTIYVLSDKEIYQSTDYAETWEPVANSSFNGNCTYLKVGILDNTDYFFLGCTNALLVKKGTEGSFQPAMQGGVDALALSAKFSSNKMVLASLHGDGLFKSVDAGLSFNPIANELNEKQVHFSIPYNPTISPLTFPGASCPEDVIGFGMEDLFVSKDAGTSWTRIKLPGSKLIAHGLDGGLPVK